MQKKKKTIIGIIISLVVIIFGLTAIYFGVRKKQRTIDEELVFWARRHQERLANYKKDIFPAGTIGFYGKELSEKLEEIWKEMQTPAKGSPRIERFVPNYVGWYYYFFSIIRNRRRLPKN